MQEGIRDNVVRSFNCKFITPEKSRNLNKKKGSPKLMKSKIQDGYLHLILEIHLIKQTLKESKIGLLLSMMQL